MPAFLARCLLAASFLLLFPGCGKEKNNSSFVTDAHGYFCPKCQAKFYTGTNVTAAHCPACKALDTIQVAAFVCEKDQHLNILPRSKMMKCEQCEEIATHFRLPTEAELKAWGAAKKSQAEVSN